MIPMARELDAIRAMAASLFNFPVSDRRSSRIAAITTTGRETGSGENPMARATDSAPKDTWDRPSPIMEYRFNTRLTPSSEAQRETRIPTTNARVINE